jgi:hypothetical protein
MGPLRSRQHTQYRLTGNSQPLPSESISSANGASSPTVGGMPKTLKSCPQGHAYDPEVLEATTPAPRAFGSPTSRSDRHACRHRSFDFTLHQFVSTMQVSPLEEVSVRGHGRCGATGHPQLPRPRRRHPQLPRRRRWHPRLPRRPHSGARRHEFSTVSNRHQHRWTPTGCRCHLVRRADEQSRRIRVKTGGSKGQKTHSFSRSPGLGDVARPPRASPKIAPPHR